MGQITKIVSGGQTGADRAALDWAIANGVSHGGWCPLGRLAEDGVLDPKYMLTETESAGYRQRRKKNVIDSDGTLVTNLGEFDGGSLATAEFARRGGKPYVVIQLDEGVTDAAAADIALWLRLSKVVVLNVAGPRESKRPGIYALTRELLERVAKQLMSIV